MIFGKNIINNVEKLRIMLIIYSIINIIQNVYTQLYYVIPFWIFIIGLNIILFVYDSHKYSKSVLLRQYNKKQI